MKKFSKTTIAIGVLIIFYTVGIVGISLEAYRAQFANLSALNLLLTAVVLFWANENRSTKFVIGLSLTMLIGFLVEVAGVHTGVLFGVYHYGETLGLKLFEVPLIIGVNWFLLAFAARGIALRITPNPWIQIAAAAALMVLLDFLIEPVAIALDFWQWEAASIPIQNYVMWFLTALPIQYILQKIAPVVNTKLCFAVYLIQMAFFLVLNLTL